MEHTRKENIEHVRGRTDKQECCKNTSKQTLNFYILCSHTHTHTQNIRLNVRLGKSDTFTIA